MKLALSRWTASSSARAFACAHWLDEDTPVRDEPPGPHALRGTAIHAQLARAVDPSLPPPDPEHLPEWATEAWAYAAVAEFYSLHGYGLAAEVPLSSVDGFLPRSGHRDYSEAFPGSLCGTVDMMWRATISLDTGRYVVWVLDWKTGFPRASDRTQMEVLMWLAAHAFKETSGIGQLVYISEDGSFESKSVSVDLAAVGARIEAARSEDRDPLPVPGEHCRYCPAYQCREAQQSAQVSTALTTTEAHGVPLLAHVTRDTAAGWHRALPLLRDVLAARDRELRAVLADGAVSLGDGTCVELAPVERTTIAPLTEDEARMLTAEVPTAAAALRISTSAAALKAAKAEAAVQWLHEHGKTKTTTTTTIRTRKERT